MNREKNGGNSQSSSFNINHSGLKTDALKIDPMLNSSIPQKMNNSSNNYTHPDSEHESDGSDIDDHHHENLIKQNMAKNSRTSVSAEVYGQWNKKTNYVPKVIPKSEDQISRLKKRLEQVFLFSSLDENDKSIVIKAMEEKKFKKDEYVIKQGEDGNELYVIDQGELDCYKVIVQYSNSKKYILLFLLDLEERFIKNFQ